ncbi:hypothetical protein FLAG1_09995 [Fusarium langsethiae]|uniref:Rhodopsin domain-containing protein n=1 Tax=Fusarium langsethiae TaxID=179993 RepID=A0A0M9EPG5_FUSLA|nr:hypothetical protein FLAG1_09995 [Fusarium langsethiae]
MRNPGAEDVLVSEILVVVAIVLVAARLNLRLRIQKRQLLLSDKFMVAACISGVVAAGFTPAFAALDAFDPKVHSTLQGYSGNRRKLRLILKLLFASNFPFYTTLYLCKAVLLSVYLQVFPEFMTKRHRHWELNANMTCQTWTYAVNFNVGWALSFLGDVLVFILPWLIVPALQVKRALRLGIYFTFLLGTVNMAVSLVRFVMIFKAGADSAISLSTIVLWSALDVNIGLVVACLPSLRPYFGSRNQSERPSFESRNEERHRRPSKFGIDTLRHNYRKYDEEESSSFSERQNARETSHWEHYDVISDDGRRSYTDVSDVELVELRLPPVAKVTLNGVSVNNTRLDTANIKAFQDFIFPGGQTFAFRNFHFSDNQDILASITYSDPN